jgi:hypothetical protein
MDLITKINKCRTSICSNLFLVKKGAENVVIRVQLRAALVKAYRVLIRV